MDGRVGSIISGTFGMVRDRFGPLLGLWAVYLAIQIGLGTFLAIMMGASFAETMETGNPDSMGGGMMLAFALFYLVYFLAAFAQTAAMIAMKMTFCTICDTT